MPHPGDGWEEEDLHDSGRLSCVFIVAQHCRLGCAHSLLHAVETKCVAFDALLQVSAKDHSRFAGSYATILKVCNLLLCSTAVHNSCGAAFPLLLGLPQRTGRMQLCATLLVAGAHRSAEEEREGKAAQGEESQLIDRSVCVGHCVPSATQDRARFGVCVSVHRPSSLVRTMCP